MRLDGRTAIVSGAARGIGRGIALGFLEEGANVVGIDIDPIDVAGLERMVGYQVDVTRRDQVDGAVQGTLDRFGTVDIAVCNAGFLRYAPFLELSEDLWRATIDIDLTGVFHLAQAAARVMATRGGGSIVVISSASDERPSKTQGHYAAAKAGARMLTEAMAWELGVHRIRVNSIGPGWVETRITADYLADPGLREEVERTIPIGRVGQPEDIARAAAFLASDESSYITGAHLRMDGGLIVGKDKT